MSILTILSFIIGVVLIVVSIIVDGDIGEFYNLQSVLITIGGTIAATCMSFPGDQLLSALKAAKFAFGKPNANYDNDIDMIINMATVARKGGLLALENEIDGISNHFVRKGIMLIVDGSSSELVKSVMETEMDNIYDRHTRLADVYRRAASYAPAYGMIGTLIGLINMLLKLSDPASLGPAMAVALITTFYGCIMANLVFTPISNKLDVLNDNEELHNRIFLEGILSIQVGENPRIIKDKLEAFIPAYAIRNDGKDDRAAAAEN